MNDKQKSAKSTKSATATDKTFEGFTDEERAAMKQRAQELKAASRRGPRADKADEESAVLAKIAEMPAPDDGPKGGRPPWGGSSGLLGPQLTAFFTSAPILASSAAVSFFSAKEVGHMLPSSRFASALKPNVAYRSLNFDAGVK